jgi:myosin heavy chain 6/7
MMIEPNPKLYYFIAQGMITIDNVDDAKEMKDCDEAFDILNFTQVEKEDLFKLTAVCCHWGNSKWKQRPREEQAEADGTEECEKVAALLGVDIQDLLKGLLKPRIKVGNEFVNKGQNLTQVVNSIGALCKSIYSRAFNWLVVRVNETLDVKTKRQFFIGVLDIAGFEIFEENGFEQLCINYTNERLQQFFNHHMFVVEQEEYKKEGIQWEMMNFGLDLQACIDLIEKPLGIMSILEEECIVPKATDKTFQEKLYTNHLGKHPNFGKPKPQKGKAEAHFDLHHYAGTVSYSVTGWLEKNKDPINTTVATLFKFSKTNALLSLLYQDMGVEEEKGAKKGKSGSNQTISSGHREQLNKLMNTLKQTSPHFVRCIIPNEVKTGGILDPHLVMHQLTCNGVLEGIRICRKGFPNRVYYPDFKFRYAILAPAASKSIDDPIKCAGAILKEVALNEELFRLGLTKVFFKSGVIGQLEDLRDTAISKIISMLQAHMRVFYMKKHYKVLLEQRLALSVLQRNIKKYITLRTWPWWMIYCNLKPLLNSSARRAEEEEKARLAAEEEARRLAEEQERIEREKREREEAQARLQKERDEFLSKIQELQTSLTKTEQKLAADTAKYENQIKSLEEKLAEGESAQSDLVAKRKRLEQESHSLKGDLDETQTKLMRAESLVKNHEHEINKLKDLNRQQEEVIAKITREKKRAEEATSATADQLAQEETKVSNLTKLKGKLELELEETNENLEKERRVKGDLEKVKRKLEGELKQSLLQAEDLQRFKKDLEESLRRKEGEFNELTATNEDQQALNNSLHKKIKELSQRLDDALNDLDTERQGRAKAEKQRSDLQIELDELQALLDEAGDSTVQQGEIKKRLEGEIAKIKHELDESHIQHENVLTQLKKKFQEELDEAVETIDRLEKAKNKFEKDLKSVKSEVDEAKSQADGASKARSNLDKTVKTIKKQLQDATTELDELKRVNGELTTSRNSLKAANNTMKIQVEDLESKLNALNKLKSQMQSQIDAAKQEALEESNAKRKLQEQLSGNGSPTKSKR